MIPGVYTLPGGTAISPSGVLVTADFLLGIYEVNGVAVTAASLVSDPALIGVSGMAITYDEVRSQLQALGGLLAALITGEWTLVIEVKEDAGEAGGLYLLFVESVATPQDFIWIQSGSSNVTVYDQDSTGSADRTASASAPARTSVRRAAITRTSAMLSISVNGGAVSSDTLPLTPLVLDTATIGADGGSFSFFNGFVRRIIVYNPVADAALPGLSTV